MPPRIALVVCAALILSASAVAALPARVTLDGVAGVVPGMQPDEVARRWGIAIPDNIRDRVRQSGGPPRRGLQLILKLAVTQRAATLCAWTK